MNPLIINLVFHIAVSLLPLKFIHKSWSTPTWLHKVSMSVQDSSWNLSSTLML